MSNYWRYDVVVWEYVAYSDDKQLLSYDQKVAGLFQYNSKSKFYADVGKHHNFDFNNDLMLFVDFVENKEWLKKAA